MSGGVALQTSDDWVQFGVLPWRRTAAELELLLITTQTTHRWIVPKGWPIPQLKPTECAAREAFEEAGVEGQIAEIPFGTFLYEKRLKSGLLHRCRVTVFTMKVTHQRRDWPERSLRESCWCSIGVALERVQEPGLRRLIAAFASSQETAAEVPATAR